MTIRIDIYVSDVIGLLDAGYEDIKVYSSPRKETDYSEITSSSSRIPLYIDQARYSYSDVFGTADTWYKWSYYSSTGPIESSLSPSLRGTISGSVYRGATYPSETDLTSPQQDVIYRIRQYIGDMKEVNHDYLSPTTSYDNVSTDGYTVSLDNPKGWPLSISVNSTQYTNIVDPIVRGYQFVTFSGTQIDTTSGIVDIWYHHFRFSDREILDAYNAVELPVGVTLSMVTPEMFEIQCSIKLLEMELRNFLATSSSKVAIYEEITIDPGVGINARQTDLKSLKSRLSELVRVAVSNNVTLYGVRID